MKSFNYTITDEIGIHARPAGLLVKEASKFRSLIKITNLTNDKSTEANKLFGVMGLCVKKNDSVNISINGEDEEDAYVAMKNFFQNNL